MTSSTGINYRDTYFEFPELTKIHGEPDSESLLRMRNELKANAQSVYSNLSDGAHGHLALVLSDQQYGLITNAPFVRPVHPGVLTIPQGTTGPIIATRKDAHTEQHRLFREVTGVEKALIQQIVKAVDAPYLAALRDRNSNSLRGTVYQILEHLQTVYGKISPQMLENKEQELRTMVYNAKFPIEMVFNAIEEFVDYAELAQQPITQLQTIAKAYIILNKTGRFKLAITKWNCKPNPQKTWINFKTHFRQAHQEFRETTDITLEESELTQHNANLVQQVLDGLQSVITPITADSSETSFRMQQMVNSATQANETQQQIQAQLLQMQQAMAALQAQVLTQPSQPSHYLPQYQPVYPNNQQFQGYSGRGSRTATNGRGRGNRQRIRNTSIYCWTHGGCGHSSAACNHKLPGHQDNATFTNRMNGNSNNCPSD